MVSFGGTFSPSIVTPRFGFRASEALVFQACIDEFDGLPPSGFGNADESLIDLIDLPITPYQLRKQMKNLRHLLRRVSPKQSRRVSEDRSRGQRQAKRRLLSETLENRQLLAGDVGAVAEPVDDFNTEHNYWSAYDVDNNKQITALDALRVINHLNADSQGEPLDDSEFQGFLDVSNDNRVTALDALMVINALNSGEGEDMDPLVAFELTARDFNDNLISNTVVSQTTITDPLVAPYLGETLREYTVQEGDKFKLEVAVQDLRFQQAQGVFRAVTDILVDQSDVLVPAVGEVQRLRFDEVLTSTEGASSTIRFSLADGSFREVTGLQLTGGPFAENFVAANNLRDLLVDLHPDIDSADEITVTAVPSTDTFDFTIEYNADKFIGRTGVNPEMPSVSFMLDGAPRTVTPIEEDTFNADGSFNGETLVTRFEVLSRNSGPPVDNVQVYGQERNIGTFDIGVDDGNGNTIDRFTEVGSLGPVGQIRTFIPNFSSNIAYDAFSIPVIAVSAATDVNIQLGAIEPGGDPNDPADQTDGVLIYGTTSGKEAVPANMIFLDDDARLILNVTPGQTGVSASNGNLSLVEDDQDGESLTVTATAASGTLAYSILQDGQKGTATIDPTTGLLNYVPDANAFGADTVIYRAEAGGESDSGTITINIDAVNDPPTVDDDEATVEVGNSIRINVLENDSPGPGESVSDIDLEILTQPTNGSVVVDNDATFGEVIVYTSTGSSSVVDTFTYRINDGALNSAAATVSVTVTNTSTGVTAFDKTGVVVAEDSAETEVADFAADNLIRVNVVDQAVVTSIESTSAGSARIENGKILYTPAANDDTSATVVYRASNNPTGTADDDLGTIFIDLTPVNDAPVTPNFDTVVVNERSTRTFNVLQPGGSFTPVSDVDNPNSELTVVIPSGQTFNNLTVSVVNNNVVIQSTGAADNLDRSFRYEVRDPAGASSEGVINVVIQDVLDAPVANNGPLSGVEDTGPLTIDLDTLTVVEAGDTPSYSIVSQASGLGTATIGAGGVLSLALTQDAFGTGEIVYQATGGNGNDTGTIAVTVTAVNDAPKLTNINRNVLEDTFVDIDVAALGNDVDSANLTAAVVSQPTNGTAALNADGTVRYTPTANYTGPDSFQVSVSDGALSATATVNINVTDVVSAPVASDGSLNTAEDTVGTLSLTGLVTVDAGDTFALSITTQPTNGTATINAQNQLVYTPGADFSGTDTLVYTASNSGGSDTGTIAISVGAVNDAPVAVNDSRTTELNTAITIDVIANDNPDNIDPNDVYTVSVEAGNGPANGTLSFNGNQITYTPNADFFGQDSFTYTLSDGALTDTAVVSITVQDVNLADISGQLFGDAAVNVAEVLAGTAAPEGNGVLDTGEVAFGGVEVRLVQGEQVVRTTLSNAKGEYLFENVPEGEYRVDFMLAALAGSGSEGLSTPITVGAEDVNANNLPALNPELIGVGLRPATGANILSTGPDDGGSIPAGEASSESVYFNFNADGSFAGFMAFGTLRDSGASVFTMSLSESGQSAVVTMINMSGATPVVRSAIVNDSVFRTNEDMTQVQLFGEVGDFNFVEDLAVDATEYPDFQAAIDRVLQDM